MKIEKPWKHYSCCSPRCPVCDGMVKPFGEKICLECLPKLKPVTAPWCMKCGKKWRETENSAATAAQKQHMFDRPEHCMNMRRPLRQSIVLSISGRQEYGEFFSEKKWENIGRFYPAGYRPDVIVPVPLYRGKLSEKRI